MRRRFVTLYTLLLVPALVFVGCGDDEALAPDTTAPLAPVFEGANVESGVVAAWWQANAESDLSGYFVYVIQAGQTSRTNSEPLTQAYTTISVDPGTPVRVYVTAVDVSGNESSPSATRKAEQLDRTDDDRRVGIDGRPAEL